MTRISGTTRLIAHLGFPTESFRAPMIYNPYFASRGIDAVVVPMGCRAENYAAFLRPLFRLSNIQGALVTMPHKITTVGLLDEVTTTVKVAGACNAIRLTSDGRLLGDMFDGEGFVRGMERKGRRARGARALVVGSGGVGSAIVASLAKAGASAIGLFDPNALVMTALAERIRAHYPGVDVQLGNKDPSGWDIVVNATPLGMKAGDPLPVDVERIAPTTFVGEVVMKTEITPFLAVVRERGCAYQVGTDMLFEMIPAYLDFFGFPAASTDELRRVAEVTY